MAAPRFDVIVIGSGPAGLAAAEAAKDAGAKHVAIIEAAEHLGGECPNWGCVPTKALLRSSDVLREVRGASAYGVNVEGITPDFSAMMRRKNKIVNALTNNPRMEGILKKLDVELIRGSAEFVSKDTVKVGRKTFTSRAFVIATGSKTFIPPIEGITDVPYVTSDDLVGLKSLPKSMAIVGGGPIGAEFADFYAALGVKITIIEFMPQILSREEPEVAQVVEKAFTSRGIDIQTNRKVMAVAKKGDLLEIKTSAAESEKSVKMVTAEMLVIATGKRPAIESLGAEKAGIRLDKKGVPMLDAYLRTSNRRIYFAGDVAGQMMFTHVAHMQGEAAGRNAVKPRSKKSDLRVIPRGTFCTPEVGSVGMTEQEAKDGGRRVAVGTGSYAGLGKSLTTGKTDGLVKIVVDAKTKRVLGGHVVGQSAAEIVHEIALAMYANIPATAIADMVHTYPTYSEAVGIAAYNAIENI